VGHWGGGTGGGDGAEAAGMSGRREECRSSRHEQEQGVGLAGSGSITLGFGLGYLHSSLYRPDFSQWSYLHAASRGGHGARKAR